MKFPSTDSFLIAAISFGCAATSYPNSVIILAYLVECHKQSPAPDYSLVLKIFGVGALTQVHTYTQSTFVHQSSLIFFLNGNMTQTLHPVVTTLSTF